MPSVAQRIIVSRAHEIPWVLMAVEEARGLDIAIHVFEHNFSHSGRRVDFEFSIALTELGLKPQELGFSLWKVDGEKLPVRWDSLCSEDDHWNEELTRTSCFDVLDNLHVDVLLCTDADEIVFRRFLRRLSMSRAILIRPISFKLHNFFFAPTLFDRHGAFWGPSVGRYETLRKTRRTRYWRPRYPTVAGSHFSWVLPPDEAAKKHVRYSHAHDYGSLSPGEIQRFVEQRTLGWTSLKGHHLDLVSHGTHSWLYPQTFELTMRDLMHQGIWPTLFGDLETGC